ncbi:MAG TPA: hypothetical protein VJR58_26960 [Vineibacter sp.]|nr:hypothetical protein [Vineibacter sp.]
MYEATVDIPDEIASDPAQLEILKQAAASLTFGRYRIVRSDRQLVFGFATLLNARLFRKRLAEIGGNSPAGSTFSG